jgi:integrase/recombinase XerD
MSPDNTFTSGIGSFIGSYLALKEALGRRYCIERRTLTHLDQFLSVQPRERSQLTAQTFDLWAASFQHLTPTVRRNRMRIARNLCLYRRRTEPTCFVPDPSGFPKPTPAHPAHIFTDQQIVRLLEEADRLQAASTSPLYREGLRLAIVLLYTSGLRRGEVVRLTLGDYDPDQQTLRIRDTKFHKSRVVPLSSQTASEMTGYLQARRRLPHCDIAPLLCNCHGGLRPYSGTGLALGIRRLFARAQIRTVGGRLPRIHDLRHTFAVHALHRWYREGTDVQAKLPALATYMGHVSIVSTQHYLAVLDLLDGRVEERFARHCAAILSTDAMEGGAA